MPILRQIDVAIDVSPEELAEIFCGMDSGEQARFFNKVATVTNSWPRPFCMQLQEIADDELLTPMGRTAMEQIGQYAHAQTDSAA